MIGKFTDIVKCEICDGVLELDPVATVGDYINTLPIEISNISDKVEDIVGKYLVYVCESCGKTYKYTYKDLEYLLRKKLTEKLLLLTVRGEITSANVLNNKFLVFCGKCTGFDGQGCCPKSVVEKCEIKRFPIL